MILNNTPQDQAVLSNVGQIGEFRIRNSAKAFNILSSGLYANKIRAIIRELSCNAVDSHVAAGKADTPFDVHLPNVLEPWFSIRDYGTGLSNDQVINIYTTYFESTKTDSNEFIGALGLGSKSPFSYTDNFTVTAVKNGRKGIYTAFINNEGIPSIALMCEEESTDPNGVEVKFSVNDKYDYDKFVQEAKSVYKYFKLRPIISGVTNFKFVDPEYADKNIVPGVHHLKDVSSYGAKSIAIMGNIAYPIDVPAADKTLGNLRELLDCGLVIEFDIGELDFQASREGLSYIPLTIESIKRKLEKLNSQLVNHIAKDADPISNLWERGYFLNKKRGNKLWHSAVDTYVTNTKFPLVVLNPSNYEFIKPFKFTSDELKSKFNIVFRPFQKSKGQQQCSTLKPRSEHNHALNCFVETWVIYPNSSTYFVYNDTKTGASQRAKHHWKNLDREQEYSEVVYVIEAAEKGKPVKVAEFFDAIMNPPANQVMKASGLIKREHSVRAPKNVSILKLEERRTGRWNTNWAWARAGKLGSMDNTKTFYYVEMVGWSTVDITNIKDFREHLVKSGIYSGDIYGIRKADIEGVRKQKNWVNLTTMVKEKLTKLDQSDVMEMVKQSIDLSSIYKYNVTSNVDPNSPYVKLHNVFKDVKDDNPIKRQSLQYLCRHFNIENSNKVDPTALIAKYNAEVEAMKIRYPLLLSLSYSSVKSQAVAEYINLIDQSKGI